MRHSGLLHDSPQHLRRLLVILDPDRAVSRRLDQGIAGQQSRQAAFVEDGPTANEQRPGGLGVTGKDESVAQEPLGGDLRR